MADPPGSAGIATLQDGNRGETECGIRNARSRDAPGTSVRDPGREEDASRIADSAFRPDVIRYGQPGGAERSRNLRRRIRRCVVSTAPTLAATMTAARLTPEPESLDQLLVPHRTTASKILEQPTPLADDPQQAAARVMVLRVRLEVIGQLVDAFGQQCDLDFGGSRVLVVDAVTLNDG